MEEHRRSGYDRRRGQADFPHNRRSGHERRRLLREFPVLREKVRNTDIFRGMTDDQFKSILSIGREVEFGAGETVFTEGDYAEDVFILIEGILQVSLHNRELSVLAPAVLVGEMGVFTGDPRSATIVAKTDATLLKLNELELLRLFENDPGLCRQFQHGMIIDLAHKLRQSNETITTFKGR